MYNVVVVLRCFTVYAPLLSIDRDAKNIQLILTHSVPNSFSKTRKKEKKKN
uniref:Uncharacterized protein n=1 Tax=Rhizophora mucronata TaxID=61149 RepID=A0A2P2R034_RHIMU